MWRCFELRSQHDKIMPVYFNYFEELSENTFFLKHLDQAELYLVIEYDSEPTFFLASDFIQSFEVSDQLFHLKFIKNYTPLSKKIAEKNPMPWGAYVLTLTHSTHSYSFVYEILDPQGQAFFISQFETLFKPVNEKKSQTPDDFMKTRLYLAYQNVFSHPTSFGELKTGAIKDLKLLPAGTEIIPSHNCFRFPLKIGDTLKFSAKLHRDDITLFLDHFDRSPEPKNPSEIFTIRISNHQLKKIQNEEPFIFDAGKLTSYLSQELEILSKTGDILKKYRLFIRNGREKEKIWDSSPLPFAKLSSLRRENIPSLVHKNMLESYHEDYGLFWGITDEPHAPLHYQSKKDDLFIYFLPLNFYNALTLQRLQWKEPPFQNYIDASLKLISFAYYLYEDDPRYSEWFHQYFNNQMSSAQLILKTREKYDELLLKPLPLWSSLDAMECLNICYVAEREKNKEILKVSNDFLKLLQKRLATEPHATSYHARIGKKEQTCSPHGPAILAMLKGFELFKEESFKEKAREQLEFLLKTYPIEEQTFVLGRYDTSALVNTTAALQRAVIYFSEYKSTLEKARKRIIEEWLKKSPLLPLSTQIEVLGLK